VKEIRQKERIPCDWEGRQQSSLLNPGLELRVSCVTNTTQIRMTDRDSKLAFRCYAFSHKSFITSRYFMFASQRGPALPFSSFINRGISWLNWTPLFFASFK